jgi:hypothetical protein
MDASARHGRPPRRVVEIFLVGLTRLILPKYRNSGPLQSALSYKDKKEERELTKSEGMPAHKLCLRVLLLAFFAMAGASQVWAAVFSADTVKAAFLYRFASYVEWPDDAPSGPFIIAVSGADAVAEQLERLLPGMTVHGRPAQVRRVARPSDLEVGVHILYIGPDSIPHTRALRESAAKLPILIVTDDARGFEAGGVINFIEANRNVRFEISLTAADRQRVRINSALLSVAARVERRPQAGGNCVDPQIRRIRPSLCVIRTAQNVVRGMR